MPLQIECIHLLPCHVFLDVPKAGSQGLCGPYALPRFQRSDEDKQKDDKGQLGMRVLGFDCCCGMLWQFGANIFNILPLLNDSTYI